MRLLIAVVITLMSFVDEWAALVAVQAGFLAAIWLDQPTTGATNQPREGLRWR